MGNKTAKQSENDNRIVGTASAFHPSDIAYSNAGYSGEMRVKICCFDYDDSLKLLAAGNSKGDVLFFGKLGIWKRLPVAPKQSFLVAMRFLKYERKLLAMSDEGGIFEIDLQSMSIQQLRLGKFSLSVSFFCPAYGDRNLFVGTKGGSISLYDLRHRKFNELTIPSQNKDASSVLLFASNWQHPYLYLLIYDTMEAYVYDIQRQEVAEKFSHVDNFRSGAWCHDGKHVILGCDDGLLLMYQTQNKIMRSEPIKFTLTDEAVRLPIFAIKPAPSKKGSKFWCSGGSSKKKGVCLVSLIHSEDHKSFQILSQVSPIFGGTVTALHVVNSYVFFGANSLNLAMYNEKSKKTHISLIDGSLLNKAQIFSIINEKHHSLIDDIAVSNQKAQSLLQFALQGGFDDDEEPESVKYAITGRGFKLQFWTVYNDLQQFELIYTLNVPAFAKDKVPVEQLKTICAVETSFHSVAIGFQSGHVVVIDYETNHNEPCVHCFSIHTASIRFIRFAACLNRMMIIDDANSLSVVDLSTDEVKALEMFSNAAAEIVDITVAPLMATPVPGDVCFWIGFSDGSFKVFDCMRCQEWKLADQPPLQGTLLKIFVVDAIGQPLKCIEPKISEAAPAMESSEKEEENLEVKKQDIGIAKNEEDFEEVVKSKKKDNFSAVETNEAAEGAKVIESTGPDQNEGSEKEETGEVTAVESEAKSEKAVENAEPQTASEAEPQLQDGKINGSPSPNDSTESFEHITIEEATEAVNGASAETKKVVSQLEALGFIDQPKNKRSSGKSSKKSEPSKEEVGKRSPETKAVTDQPGGRKSDPGKAATSSKAQRSEDEVGNSEGWLIIATTKAIYTIGLLPSKYAWKKNEEWNIDGIVDCAILNSSYRTGLVLLTRTHFTVLRLMDMKVLSTIPHRLQLPISLSMYQSGWWICRTNQKRYYHGTFLLDEDTRDFSLPLRALQKREFTPPAEKSRSEGWIKKKSLPSIEEIMTKHKPKRKPKRAQKSNATKEEKAISGVGAARNKMNENLRKAAERGEKISELADKSAALSDQTDKFASLAKKLRQQQESSWF